MKSKDILIWKEEMRNTLERRVNISCNGRCPLEISKRKCTLVVGAISVSLAMSLFLVCTIVLGLQTQIRSQIDDSLNHLDENNLSDYDFQTIETLLVRFFVNFNANL